MTATRKLFLAAVIVAAGFGVARLLGEPASRWYAPQLAAAPVQEPVTAEASPTASELSAVPHRVACRLVPDFAASNPYGIQSIALARRSAATAAGAGHSRRKIISRI